MPWFPGDEKSFKTKSSFTEQKERKFISRQILLIFLNKTTKVCVCVHACSSMQVYARVCSSYQRALFEY